MYDPRYIRTSQSPSIYEPVLHQHTADMSSLPHSLLPGKRTRQLRSVKRVSREEQILLRFPSDSQFPLERKARRLSLAVHIDSALVSYPTLHDLPPIHCATDESDCNTNRLDRLFHHEPFSLRFPLSHYSFKPFRHYRFLARRGDDLYRIDSFV